MVKIQYPELIRLNPADSLLYLLLLDTECGITSIEKFLMLYKRKNEKLR